MIARVGQGVDVHAFSDDPARPLLLGGVHVPEAPGLAGHSDADVVLHAIADALLGAAGLGDLGAVFGAEDPRHAGAASADLLEHVVGLVAAAGYALGNLDLTIVAQRPSLAGHVTAITQRLRSLLDSDAVNVKVTGTDGLGAVGRSEGIACLAVVLLDTVPPA